MYAAKLMRKMPYGGMAIHVMLFEKRSERDRCVRFVTSDANAKERYSIPIYWEEGTTCEAMGMRDARKFIGDDKPIWECDGRSPEYDWTKFKDYEDVVNYVGGLWPNHTYRHRRWNGEEHYDVYEETTEYRRGW